MSGFGNLVKEILLHFDLKRKPKVRNKAKNMKDIGTDWH